MASAVLRSGLRGCKASFPRHRLCGDRAESDSQRGFLSNCPSSPPYYVTSTRHRREDTVSSVVFFFSHKTTIDCLFIRFSTKWTFPAELSTLVLDRLCVSARSRILFVILAKYRTKSYEEREREKERMFEDIHT